MFRKKKKNLSDELFLHFFFECSESDRVLNYLHDSKSIFRVGRIKSEGVSARTVHEKRQSLVSYALFQGLIVFLSIYLWLKQVIFTPMSLRTWGRKPFRVIMQQHASSSRNPQIEDTKANELPVGCPNIHFMFPTAATSRRPQIFY